MKDYMYGFSEALLNQAELTILEFDIHHRKEFERKLRCNSSFYTISYHKKGCAKLKIGDETHHITRGTVIHVPPHVKFAHYKDDSEETVFLWWHYTFRIAGILDIMNFVDIPLVFQMENADYFEHVFQDFMDSAQKPQHLPSIILKKSKSYELLYILLENAISQYEFANMKEQKNTFMDVLSRIIKNPEEPLSLKQLSEELHMHPTYISNRFKELFGKSPLHIHKEMKIRRAQSLLETTDLMVLEISEHVGFSSVQSFSRLFKSYVGISPVQYRDINWKWKQR